MFSASGMQGDLAHREDDVDGSEWSRPRHQYTLSSQSTKLSISKCLCSNFSHGKYRDDVAFKLFEVF